MAAAGINFEPAARLVADSLLRQMPVAPIIYSPRVFQNPRTTLPVTALDEPPTRAYQTTRIGNQNIAEYFLHDLVQQFIARRREKAENDPAYTDRINPDFLLSNRINFLLLGTDETRERFDKFNGQGWGRADVILFISFDPRTFQTVELSLPRDLFAPEMQALKLPDVRINAVTLLTQVDPSADTLSAAARIVEGATGMPIDGVVEVNLDFAQGYTDINHRFHPGIIDTLFPEGLKIYIPREINDNAYPVGYGTKRVRFLPGEQVLNGEEAVAYSRTRIDFDFGRNNRQRAVAEASARRFLQKIRGEVFWGQTATLDTLADFLLQETQEGNIFYNINIPEIVISVRRHLADLRSKPQGLLALATLALNSPEVGPDLFRSLGLSRENGMVVNMAPWEKSFSPNMLRLNGSSSSVLPNQ